MKGILRAAALGCCAALLCASCVSCKEGDSLPREKVDQRNFSKTIGEMVTLTASPEDAAQLVNDSGMSGIEAPNHLHGTKFTDMFEADTAEAATVTIDAGKVISLGELYIWNYNEDGYLDKGMKKVKIEYSVDGQTYQPLGKGTFTLAKASEKDNETYGGNLATNLEDGNEPISFDGAAGRFVRITPESNWGGDGFGLSEVRLFRYKIRPKKGEALPAESFPVSSRDGAAENVTNGYGMSGVDGKKDTHTNDPNTMWLSDQKAAAAALVVNLDGNYPVSSIQIYNYNDPANLGAGIKDFDLFYTTASPCNVNTKTGGVSFARGSWKRLGSYTLKQGDGSDKLQPSLTVAIEDNLHIQHLKIVPKNNYAGTETGFGLSEVRVFCGSGWAVEPSRGWTGLLSSAGAFPYQNSVFDEQNPSGWLAADGCHAINVVSDDNSQMQGSTDATTKTLFTFQDTMKGNMRNYNKENFDPTYGYALNHGGMINQSYLFLKGSEPDPRNAQFVIAGGKDSETHPLGDIFPEQYWLGDSTKIGDSIYTLANKFEELAITRQDFYKVLLDPTTGFPQYTEVAPELVHESNVSFQQVKGMTLGFDTVLELEEDKEKYIYTFGRGQEGKIIVARLKEKDYPEYRNPQYWSGKEWSSDINVLATQEATVSTYQPGNEFAVSYLNSGPMEGKFINVFTEGSIFGQVQFALSDSVLGTFDNVENLYYPSEMYKIPWRYEGYSNGEDNMFSMWIYNAKAQPAISKEGELLITYHNGAQNVPARGMFSTTALEYGHPWFICMFGIAE